MATPAPTRDLKAIKFFTIHHSAVFPGAKDKAELLPRIKQYDALHGSRSYAIYTGGEFGYKYLSYHWAIARNGDTIKCQDEKYMRWHASDYGRGKDSHNQWGIAILIDGYFHAPHNEGTTKEQVEAAARIIYDWEVKYKISAIVRGHNETSLTATACPGSRMGNHNEGVVKMIIDKVNEYHKNGLPKPPLPPVEIPCETKLQEANKQIQNLNNAISQLSNDKTQLQTQLNISNQKLSDIDKILKS